MRSTNTGISALVDPLGRITLRSGKQTRENLLGEIPVLASGGSLYLWLGDWLGWGCVAGVFGTLFVLRPRAYRRTITRK